MNDVMEYLYNEWLQIFITSTLLQYICENDGNLQGMNNYLVMILDENEHKA